MVVAPFITVKSDIVYHVALVAYNKPFGPKGTGAKNILDPLAILQLVVIAAPHVVIAERRLYPDWCCWVAVFAPTLPRGAERFKSIFDCCVVSRPCWPKQ